MFTKILVPTDGSEHAGRAVSVASDLAAKYGAELILLHVVTDYDVSPELARFAEIERVPEARTSQHLEPILAGPPHVVVPRPVGTDAAVDRHAVMHTVAKYQLEEARRIAAEQGVGAVRTVTAEGDAASRILEVARDEGADGIVMGSRGLSGLKGVVLGSVSHKVCHGADCVCIAVT